MIVFQLFSGSTARAWSILLLLGVSTAVAELAPAPASDGLELAPEPQRLAAYAGRWERKPDASAEADRLASIDAATLDLSWIMRKMATGLLRRTTTPPDGLDFFWDGETLHQGTEAAHVGPSRAIRFELEPRRRVAANGEETLTRWQWTASGLRVSWQQSQARGSNTYRLTPDGQALLTEHRIQITALESVAPIVYRAWFRRAPPPAPAPGSIRETGG